MIAMNSNKTQPYLRCAIIALLATSMCFAQTQPQSPELQGAIKTMQEVTARNEQQLRSYQWTESVTLTINGNQKPSKQSICRYAPDGGLIKTPVSPPQQQPTVNGGLLRRMIAEKKVEEFQKETADIHELTTKYLPINHDALRDALSTRRVDFEHDGPGNTAIIIHDYAKPGDEFRILLNPATMHIERIIVRSYFEKPEDGFSASVDFSYLGDGTSYPSLTIVSAPTKKILISTVNLDFSRHDH